MPTMPGTTWMKGKVRKRKTNTSTIRSYQTHREVSMTKPEDREEDVIQDRINNGNSWDGIQTPVFSMASMDME